MRFAYRSGDPPLAGYTIIEPIGRGGFGEVYVAESDAGKRVALKLIRDNLEVELRGVSNCLNLKHPNLLTIHDVRADEAGQHWIVMEYVTGPSLAAVLDQTHGLQPMGLTGAMPERSAGISQSEVLRWLEGICAAVEHLHQHGIVHRDLKPSNVFQDAGVVKIGDYGLSKFITASRRSGQTQSIGTVHYMAPEVGRGRYGKEIDLYAVGVILYEMLTGRVPFDGETPSEVLMKHLTSAPDVSCLPGRFRRVVGRLLAKRPQDRPQSALEVLAELAGSEASGPTPEPADQTADGRPNELEDPDLYRWHDDEDSPVPGASWQGRTIRVAERLGISLRTHPFGWTCCVFLTLAFLSIPASWIVAELTAAGPPIEETARLWLLISVASSAVLYAWLVLWRASAPPPVATALKSPVQRAGPVESQPAEGGGLGFAGWLRESMADNPLLWPVGVALFLLLVLGRRYAPIAFAVSGVLLVFAFWQRAVKRPQSPPGNRS